MALLENLRPLIGQGLSAAVYTQTSDVEIEVNGLMTYDREMIKMDLARATAAAKKLYLPPPIIRQIVPTSQQAPQRWQYTTDTPSDDWYQDDFSADNWKSGPGGFGRHDTPGAVVRTPWKSSDIWIRRTFELQDVSADLALFIHHDENAEVYINGRLAAKLDSYTSGYVSVPLLETPSTVLRAGQNTIAVHCHQTGGGQYIDVGLVTVEKQ